MELLRDQPLESSFIPLSEHLSQTPASFYSGPAVIYFKNIGGKLLCVKEETTRHPAIESLVKDSTDHADSWLVDGLDIWVSSEKLIFWRPTTSIGVAVPYPSISLHALGSLELPSSSDTKPQALYLEIVATDGFDDHDQEGSVGLNYVPSSISDNASSETTTTEPPSASICQQLFDAVTDCANLHPDPVSPSSSQDHENRNRDGSGADYEVLDGSELPPGLPGSGGWITSENMDQFFDEDGNWRGRGLGPGAGLIRSRDDAENGVNGDTEHVQNEDETKWRRTD